MLELAQLTTNYWTSTSANLVKTALEHPQLNQKALAKKLKKICGTGGTVVKEVIEIQGDKREEIKTILEKEGYKVKFIGG